MALQYGTATSLTFPSTPNSLASNSAVSCNAVTTSTTNNVTAILLEVSVLTTSTAPSGNKQVVVYGYKSTDGTNFSGDSSIVDNAGSGTGQALTAIGSPSNLFFIGTVQLNQGANAVTIKQDFEISGPMGGLFPKWGIVLHNDAGTALGATVTAQYREVYYN
jgi:hypothetical protein